MDNILILDDMQEENRALIKLLAEDFNVIQEIDPYALINRHKSGELNEFKILLIDIFMPQMSGYALLSQLEDIGPIRPPVFIISISEKEENVVKSLRLGVIDHLIKSTSDEINALKVKNAIEFFSDGSTPLERNGLSYNIEEVAFSLEGEYLDLTPTEIRLLKLLLNSRKEFFKKADVVSLVWKGKSVSDQTMRSHLSNLNKKLESWSLRISIDRDFGLYLKKK